MKCPSCNEALATSTYGNVEVRECLYCDGAWVSATALERLAKDNGDKIFSAQRRLSALEGNKSVSNRFCPECKDVKLAQVNVSDVELDVCPSCHGIFFDRDEIYKVMPKLEQSNGELTPAQYVGLEILSWILWALLFGR